MKQSAKCPHCQNITHPKICEIGDIVACTHCGKSTECARDEEGNLVLTTAPEAWPGSQKRQIEPGYYDDGDTISWYE